MSDAPGGFDDAGTLLQPKVRAPAADARFALVVIEGPDAGKSYVIDAACPSRVLVGQSEACAFQVTDREVSRRHAALEPAGAHLRITDLGSTNGTYVDGVRVLDALLRGGEIVRMGSTALRVDVDDRPASVRIS